MSNIKDFEGIIKEINQNRIRNHESNGFYDNDMRFFFYGEVFTPSDPFDFFVLSLRKKYKRKIIGLIDLIDNFDYKITEIVQHLHPFVNQTVFLENVDSMCLLLLPINFFPFEVIGKRICFVKIDSFLGKDFEIKLNRISSSISIYKCFYSSDFYDDNSFFRSFFNYLYHESNLKSLISVHESDFPNFNLCSDRNEYEFFVSSFDSYRLYDTDYSTKIISEEEEKKKESDSEIETPRKKIRRRRKRRGKNSKNLEYVCVGGDESWE